MAEQRPEPGSVKPGEAPGRRRTWLLVGVLILLAGAQLLLTLRPSSSRLAYSEFKQAVAEAKVQEVAVSPSQITGHMKAEPPKDGNPGKPGAVFEVTRVEDPDLLRDLTKQGVKVVGLADSAFWPNLLMWGLPLGFLIYWMVLMRRGGGMGGGAMLAAGRSKARLFVEKDIKVGFADVAGVDEAKEELKEVIEFLKHPERFGRLGGKMPKGILLVGPPGTGKTLLARAIAGEAGVPFFSISGSEFVELFVGVGAARVRDLFKEAREAAPCIIFIDELDALGKARGVGPIAGAHEEREQTLNQLLVEMDGFDPRSGVILMAATNRPEILDPALLRAGRFDRHVLVDRPDKIGRRAILDVHARGVPLERPEDLDTIAAMTAGFVGADLANLINEAALLGVRRGKDSVGLPELQEAVERIVTGLEKRNRVLNRLEKERVAHHEVGHALVALSIPGCEAVQKISIIPRGIAALGYTLQLPTEDRFLMTEHELANKIAVLLGGRAAEAVIFGVTSTGAEDDLRRATQLAKSMVRSYGMSPLVGPLTLDRERPSLFLQGEQPEGFDGSSELTRRHVDAEVRRIIDEQEARARGILESRQGTLRRAAEALLAKETLSGEELRAIAIDPPDAEPAKVARAAAG